jgi:hypothetical protein
VLSRGKLARVARGLGYRGNRVLGYLGAACGGERIVKNRHGSELHSDLIYSS